jgi:hypothetical protein
MPLTMQELENGIAYWRNGTKWPADFHNAFYGELADQDPHGNFDLAWWQTFSRHLSAWRANRPLSGRELTANAEREFEALTQTWERCCAPHAGRDITGVRWDQVADWVEVVAAIKPVRSPVFLSKFSHFLLPQVYPVVDRAVMGMPFGATYRAHFQGVQKEWATTPADTQQELQAQLLSRIGAPLAPTYPVINKVVEICLIGRRPS